MKWFGSFKAGGSLRNDALADDGSIRADGTEGHNEGKPYLTNHKINNIRPLLNFKLLTHKPERSRVEINWPYRSRIINRAIPISTFRINDVHIGALYDSPFKTAESNIDV